MGTAQKDVSRKRLRGGGVGGVFLTSLRTPLSERLEQAKYTLFPSFGQRDEILLQWTLLLSTLLCELHCIRYNKALGMNIALKG